MKKVALVAGGLSLFFSATAFALVMQPGSISLADQFFPSYGKASHFDQYNEWLGEFGNIYDGLTWSPFVQGMGASIDLTAHVGEFWELGDWEYLSIWVDWDQNRVFDADEEIADLDDYWFDYGDNLLSFNFTVPSDAVLGETWMRSRFTFDGNLAPTDAGMGGMAFTGEVEDYAVSVAPIPEPSTFLLLGTGLLGLAGYGRVRRRGKKKV